MHSQAQVSELAVSHDWILADLAIVPQFALALAFGYAASRAAFSLRSSKPRQKLIEVDDVQVECDEDDEGCKIYSMTPPQSTIQARRSNAQERKRARKSKKPCDTQKAEIEQDNEEPQYQSPQLPLEEDVPQVTVEPEAAVLPEASVADNVTTTSKRKTRKRKSQTLKKEEVEEVAEEVQVCSVVMELKQLDSDSASQDGQSACTPSTSSMVSSGSENWESDTSLTDATTVHDVQTMEPSTSEDECAGDGDHELENDEANAMHKTATEMLEDVGIPVEPSDAAICTHDSIEQSMSESIKEQGCESQSNSGMIPAMQKAESLFTVDGSGCINFDELEFEGDSDDSDDDNAEVYKHIATPEEVEEVQFAPEIANAPIMWCGVPDEMAEQPVEWMAVAVPVDMAPAGAFDGLWTNNMGETILIDKLQIMFESGFTWQMEMHSLTSISVQLNGQDLHADFDNGTLRWNDGDVWTFLGQPVTAAMDMPCSPCMTMPLLPNEATTAPEMTQVLKKAENWEICWDWKKKGRCPRGAKCEWYHPQPEKSFF
jgi:hypothetical protein